MKCSNCDFENKPGASFCGSCGKKLETETKEENNKEITNDKEEKIVIPMKDNNNQENPKKKNKIWLILGIIAAVIVILIAVGSGEGEGSLSPAGGSTSDSSKLGNYLTSNGFTKQGSTKYTYYKEGYLYTFDLEEDIFSQEGDSMYNAYYFKEDMFGTAMVSSNGIQIVAVYNLSTYEYGCETKPTSYQSYACSYMKSSVIELAAAMKKTFYNFINNAGVSSIYNL